jgi:hypothetical protein
MEQWLWDVDSRRCFHTRTSERCDRRFTLDGRLSPACYDGNVRLWDTANWSVRRSFAAGNRLAGISLARWVFLPATDSVKLWDGGQVLGQWPTTPNWCRDGILADGQSWRLTA